MKTTERSKFSWTPYPVTVGRGHDVHHGNPETGLTLCGRAYTDLAGDGSRYTPNTLRITCATCQRSKR